MNIQLPPGVAINAPPPADMDPAAIAAILSPQALAFVADLHRKFDPRRRQLLDARRTRQSELDAGKLPNFLESTKHVRDDNSWRVPPPPADLADRRCEITGPVDRKMVINALNSGAKMFMADFEDSNSPTWENNIRGQFNLRDAVTKTIAFSAPGGKEYKLNKTTATLLVRPRGWHLVEKYLLVDGQPISGSLIDFGLYFFHNARELLARHSGPYFYLPKMESHLEARLWNDVFVHAQQALKVPHGTIRATVLIETILAAFEMEEILYELRDHSAGLNAGRWDYLFSIIKKFHSTPNLPGASRAVHGPGFLWPDRSQLTMTVPFMRAYAKLLVKTCHKRGAHAMGGMAAFIPSRKDPAVNEVAMAKVREDKERESTDGFDGTWVAHPDLVVPATQIFDKHLGNKPNQLDRQFPDTHVTADQLLAFAVPGGQITEAGVRNNISVSLQYLEAWLRGNGCVPIFNLMEDAATAEISRSQLWQWVHSPDAKLADGRKVTPEMFRALVPEELEKIKTAAAANYAAGKFPEASKLLDELVTAQKFPEFLTLPAYERLV